MNEIIKKIDEMKAQAQRLIVKETHDKLDEIANDISNGYITACDELKDFILFEQKEKTNFDVITESPERLADLIENGTCCEYCVHDCRLIDIPDENKCNKGILAFLNQKAEEE